eukprot:3884641-Pleurochrysis_carterae.AAC.1
MEDEVRSPFVFLHLFFYLLDITAASHRHVERTLQTHFVESQARVDDESGGRWLRQRSNIR